MEGHRLVGLVLADELRDPDHRGHDLILRVAELLDGRTLAGRRRRFEAIEGVVKAIVLAEHAFDGGVVAHEQRVPREAHLKPESVLDLAGGVHPLSRLVQEAALAGHARDRL